MPFSHNTLYCLFPCESTFVSKVSAVAKHYQLERCKLSSIVNNVTSSSSITREDIFRGTPLYTFVSNQDLRGKNIGRVYRQKPITPYTMEL